MIGGSRWTRRLLAAVGVVGLTFLMSICGSAAISLPSIALLPIVLIRFTGP